PSRQLEVEDVPLPVGLERRVAVGADGLHLEGNPRAVQPRLERPRAAGNEDAQPPAPRSVALEAEPRAPGLHVVTVDHVAVGRGLVDADDRGRLPCANREAEAVAAGVEAEQALEHGPGQRPRAPRVLRAAPPRSLARVPLEETPRSGDALRDLAELPAGGRRVP